MFTPLPTALMLNVTSWVFSRWASSALVYLLPGPREQSTSHSLDTFQLARIYISSFKESTVKFSSVISVSLAVAILSSPVPSTLGDSGGHPESKNSCDKSSVSGGVTIGPIDGSVGGQKSICWGGPEVSHLHDLTEDVDDVWKAYKWCEDEPGELRLKAPISVHTEVIPSPLSVFLPGNTGVMPVFNTVVEANMDEAVCE